MLQQDPAIERWNIMVRMTVHGPCPLSELVLSQREDAYKHFRWTPHTTKVAVISLVVIPASLFYVFNSTHVRLIISEPFPLAYDLNLQLKWNWAAKRKGESLKRET